MNKKKRTKKMGSKYEKFSEIFAALRGLYGVSRFRRFSRRKGKKRGEVPLAFLLASRIILPSRDTQSPRLKPKFNWGRRETKEIKKKKKAVKSSWRRRVKSDEGEK